MRLRCVLRSGRDAEGWGKAMPEIVHRNLAGIPRNEWNALAVRAVTGTVFQTYEWHRAWVHAFCAADRLRIVSVRETGGGRFCFSSHNLESPPFGESGGCGSS